MICLSSKRLLLRGVKTVVSLRHLSSVVANAEEPVAKVTKFREETHVKED